VGLVLFTDDIELYVPPAKGRSHVLRVVREILFRESAGRGTDLSRALDHVCRAQKRKVVVFVVSDFLTTGYERSLTVASKRHDVVALRLRDPREAEFPRIGVVAAEALETGRRGLVDTSSPAFQRAFAERVAALNRDFETVVRRAAVDHVDLWTDRDVTGPLAEFFRRRMRRMRR
jgi:uncharacterized protein (DUF58 family)